MSQSWAVVALVAFLVTATAAQGQDSDDIRAKLEKAKSAHKAALQKHSETVLEYLEKREGTARKEGNKKLVDVIKSQRKEFEDRGELPELLPAALKRKFATTHETLENAYAAAIKELTKANLDDAADGIERELEQFRKDHDLPVGGSSGWVPLFNGKDTAGWYGSEGSNAQWSVRDGVLTGHGSIGYLITERSDYQNFRLRVEAMLGDRGDSGICFRVQDKHVQVAYEAQFGTLPNTGSLFLFKHGDNLLAPASEMIPAGKWVTIEVLADGEHITIWIDGKRTADYQITENFFSKGPIALQQHGGQTAAAVSFRKVQIKELPVKK